MSAGVAEALMAEWARSQPDLPKRAENAARCSSRKAWRWIAEMEENAATLGAAGLPEGFHQAAADAGRPAREIAAPAASFDGLPICSAGGGLPPRAVVTPGVVVSANPRVFFDRLPALFPALAWLPASCP